MLCGLHIKIWNLANKMKKWSKEHQTLSFQFFINKSSILMLFVLFFHVVCKISNFNMWTAKHLVQAFWYWVDFTQISADNLNIDTDFSSRATGVTQCGQPISTCCPALVVLPLAGRTVWPVCLAHQLLRREHNAAVFRRRQRQPLHCRGEFRGGGGLKNLGGQQ